MADPSDDEVEKAARKPWEEAVTVQRQALAEIVGLLKETDARIGELLAGQPTDWQHWYLPQLRRAVQDQLAEFGQQAGDVLHSRAEESWQQGLEVVEAPLRLGKVELSSMAPHLDRAQLLATQSFLTGKMRDVSVALASRINTELGLVVTGLNTPAQATSAISTILNDTARARAKTIVRTELGRAFSTATQGRQLQAVKAGITGMRKQWRRSGKIHSRLSHDLADGQVVDVDKPFMIGGEAVMFPRDPQASAKNTVNCGCASLTFMAHWDMSTPGRKPFTPEEQRLNWVKRDLEGAYEKPGDDAKAVAAMAGQEAYDESLFTLFKMKRARHNAIPADMTDAEMVAIREYTGSLFEPLNNALRSGAADAITQGYARVLNQALAKLPVFEGAVRRGTDLPDTVAARLGPGELLPEGGFFSATTGVEFPGDYVFHVYSRTGRDISAFSQLPGEQEVLFPSTAKYRILRIMKNGNQTRVDLEELVGPANLREAAGAVADADPKVLAALDESAALVDAARAKGRIDPVFTTERWKKKAAGAFGIFPR